MNFLSVEVLLHNGFSYYIEIISSTDNHHEFYNGNISFDVNCRLDQNGKLLRDMYGIEKQLIRVSYRIFFLINKRLTPLLMSPLLSIFSYRIDSGQKMNGLIITFTKHD